MGIIGLIQFLIDLPALIRLAAHFGKDHRTGKRTAFALLAHTLGLVGLVGFTVALVKNLDKVDSLISLAIIGISVFTLAMAVWIIGIIVVRRAQPQSQITRKSR
jgi:uncharacterized membrane protein YidH (DUF202 family)